MDGQNIIKLIEKKLNETLPKNRLIRVLEAGGGSCMHIHFRGEKYVTTLDISPE